MLPTFIRIYQYVNEHIYKRVNAIVVYTNERNKTIINASNKKKH